MNNNWKRKCAIGFISAILVAMLMSIPMVGAKHPKPPPPPADPAIAFVQTARNTYKISVMNADGSNQAVICEWPYMIYGTPSWSPDGKSIAWAGPYGGGYGVWRIDVDVVDGVPQGSNLQQLVSVSSGGSTGSAAWSPSGNEIAYNARLWNPVNVWKIDAVPATGGEPYTIYTSPEGYGISSGTSIAWRSDSTQFAFVGGEIAAGSDGMSILIVDRATGGVVRTLLTGQHPERFDWAQGIDVLAFECGTIICTVDIDTETIVPVVAGFGPSWSPDNSKIAYQQPGRTSTICIYEFSTGNIVTLAKGQQPDWRRF